MAGFLYFIPKTIGAIGRSANLPAECKLYDIFGDVPITSGVVPGGGPEGMAGTLFHMADRFPPPLEFNADKQHWTKLFGDNGQVTHWVGWDTSRPPTPKDLIRARSVGGHPVTLGDGNDWLIPAIVFNESSLPRAVQYIDGEFMVATVTGYEDLIQESWGWAQKLGGFAGGSAPTFLLSDLYQWVVRLLALNYHVGPYEVGCGLPIITDSAQAIGDIVSAALGVHHIQAEQQAQQKKRESTPSNSFAVSPGDRDLNPITPSPSPTLSG